MTNPVSRIHWGWMVGAIYFAICAVGATGKNRIGMIFTVAPCLLFAFTIRRISR